MNANNYASHHRLGRALQAQQRFAESLVEFQEVLKLRPDFTEAQFYLGGCFYSVGKLAEAHAQYVKLTEKDSNIAAMAHERIGAILMDSGNINGALVSLQKAVELQPNDAATRNNAGWALLLAGRIDEAKLQFDRSLQLDPKGPEARNGRGSILLYKGDLKGAIDECRLATVLDPNFAAAHNNLGTALYKNGQLKEAIFEFREALRCNPNLLNAQTNLALITARMMNIHPPPPPQ